MSYYDKRSDELNAMAASILCKPKEEPKRHDWEYAGINLSPQHYETYMPEKKEEPKQVQAPYYCPAPRHGWMQKPCACLEAIKDPGVADRGFEQVQAPEEIFLVVEHDGQPYEFWTRREDVCEPIPDGGVVVRYVKAGGQ